MDERSALDVRARAAVDGRDSKRAARTRGVRGERACSKERSTLADKVVTPEISTRADACIGAWCPTQHCVADHDWLTGENSH